MTGTAYTKPRDEDARDVSELLRQLAEFWKENAPEKHGIPRQRAYETTAMLMGQLVTRLTRSTKR